MLFREPLLRNSKDKPREFLRVILLFKDIFFYSFKVIGNESVL